MTATSNGRKSSGAASVAPLLFLWRLFLPARVVEGMSQSKCVEERVDFAPAERQSSAPVTEWLRVAAEHGRDSASGRDAWESISAWSYRELELLARRRMRREFGQREVTLEPAALVNETFLRLIRREIPLENRRHYFALVSKIMLRVLIDYQRRRRAGKREFDKVHVTLARLADPGPVDSAEIDSALRRLATLDARKAEVATLRALWGLEMTEIAKTLDVSEPTVRRDWKFARNWLGVQLRRAR